MVSKHTVDGVEYSYTYDSVGNITAVRKNGNLKYRYFYDALGQLTEAIIYSDNYDTDILADVYEFIYRSIWLELILEVVMRKFLTYVALLCIVLNFYGCNNQQLKEDNDNLKSQEVVNSSFENSASFHEVSEMLNNATINLTDFMLDPYGYADAEYVDFMKNNPVDTLVNVNVDSSEYQELSEAIKNGTRIWEEEIDYAITELFKDMQDEKLQNKLLENQKTWETLAKGELSFDEELIYSNQLGGYAVNFGLSYRYMLLCRSRALHIKYLHYMLESRISDRNEADYLSLKFKNA